MEPSMKKGRRRRRQWNRKPNGFQRVTKKDEYEIELEKLVFGQAGNVLNHIEPESDAENSDIDDEDSVNNNSVKPPKAKPLWVDEDDESVGENDDVNTEGKRKKKDLKKKFKKIVGTASWAKLDLNKSKEDEAVDIMTIAGNKIRKTNNLSSHSIEVLVCRNLIESRQRLGGIVSIDFHKQLPLLLIASMNENAVISRVDGAANSVVQTIKFDHHKLTSARWAVDGQKAIATAFKRKHLFVHDLISAKTTTLYLRSDLSNREIRFARVSPDGDIIAAGCCNGFVQLLSIKANEWIQTLKMNTRVNDIAFSSNGDQMYCATESGQIHVFDMNTRECVHQFLDEGRISGGNLSMSPNDSYLAVGSRSGVVNVYDYHSLMTQLEPKPYKSIFNLTTPISSLSFNSTSEILAFASREKTNGLRLTHTPSFTTFSNFPLPWYELKYISAVEFSPLSGYLAVGTGSGLVSLYRLMHYENY